MYWARLVFQSISILIYNFDDICRNSNVIVCHVIYALNLVDFRILSRRGFFSSRSRALVMQGVSF